MRTIFLLTIAILLISFKSNAQDYSVYGNRIKYSDELKNSKLVRDLSLALQSPEMVVDLLINVKEDSAGFAKFESDYASFVNLRKLVVYNSDLKSKTRLNIDLSKLPKLEYLRIEGIDCSNGLKGLEELSNLKYLTISGAFLRHTPESIHKLVKLEVLDLSVNHITSLDTSLNALVHLRELDLSNNAFKDIPKMIADYDSLMYLDFNNAETAIGETNENFGNNSLQTYPDWIIEMPSLLSLSLYQVQVPPDVRKRIKQFKRRQLKVQY